MPLWKNKAQANAAPKSSNVAFTSNVANVAVGSTALYTSNTGPNKGWVQITKGSGGRAGRTKTEILAAIKII